MLAFVSILMVIFIGCSDDDDNVIAENTDTKNSEEYAKAPLWARKQADKYLQLMSQTKYMTYKETVEYLKRLKVCRIQKFLWFLMV